MIDVWGILGAYLLLRLMFKLLPLALIFAAVFAIFHGELSGGVLALCAVLVVIATFRRRRRLHGL